MSRTIFTTTALAGLMAFSLTGTPAQAQVIDLRLPPIGLGQSGLDPFARGSQGVPGVDWLGGIAPTSTQRTQHGFPSYSGPINPRHGGIGGPLIPGDFSGGRYDHGRYDYGRPDFGRHDRGRHEVARPGFGGPGFGGQHHPGIVSPVIGMADQLIGEVGAFLNAFAPTVHIVPQGDRMYRDASDLYNTTIAFRQAALGGAPPHELRRLHSQMDNVARRLVSRVNSVARGRTGPNIEQVRYIGALCQQIRSFL